MALLEAQAVTKIFGGLVAVGGVDLAVEERAIVSLIGPNGAGKTTFFNCLTGLYCPEEGDIIFDGSSLVGLRSDQIIALGMARTYQNIRLFANVTVLENVLVGMHRHLNTGWFGAVFKPPKVRREEKEAEQEALEILKFVDLDKKADFVAKNLPYGEQRRLEIARALAGRPRVVLLDEPTAGMNPKETEDTTSLIRRLRDERKLTILLIEHDMKVVMNVSNQITVLDFGRKIAEGDALAIRSNPEVIEAYLGRGAATGSGYGLREAVEGN